jgi:hypothetical protein
MAEFGGAVALSHATQAGRRESLDAPYDDIYPGRHIDYLVIFGRYSH